MDASGVLFEFVEQRIDLSKPLDTWRATHADELAPEGASDRGIEPGYDGVAHLNADRTVRMRPMSSRGEARTGRPINGRQRTGRAVSGAEQPSVRSKGNGPLRQQGESALRQRPLGIDDCQQVRRRTAERHQ